MRILDRAGRIAEGSVSFTGIDVRKASEREMRNLRGREMSMIFQNPRAALNPIRKVGHQIEDVLRQHAQAGSDDQTEKAIAILEQVRIARPEERYHAYPFELSGGMCQRVVIALALACRPQLLIADEPTTGLDVTTQKTVMDLIVELTRERGMSTILITHDLGLAAAYCDRVVVMEKGEVVETADVEGHLHRARPSLHPQADARDAAARRDACARPAARGEPPEASRPTPPKANGALNGHGRQPRAAAGRGGPRQGVPAQGRRRRLLPRLQARPTAQQHPRPRCSGQSTASASRSTGARASASSASPAAASPPPRPWSCACSTIPSGSIRVRRPGHRRDTRQEVCQAADMRKRIQMVFQDPTDSLNPRFTAARAIADPILRLGDVRGSKAVRARCEELARQVGLPVELLDRFPHQLSGGQKARVGIARAIALNPDLVILDEPTAALDVSVQAVVLNLLQELKEQLGMSYLFVSHDLNVVRLLCDRVIVMRSGAIVEQGPTERVLSAPESDYTRELLAAIPHPPV